MRYKGKVKIEVDEGGNETERDGRATAWAIGKKEVRRIE